MSNRNRTKVTCPRLTAGFRSTCQHFEPPATAGQVDRIGTPGMAHDLWGESPLYENEGLKVGSIPTVTPIDQVRETRNCGRVTERGKAATSQSCEATNRNSIKGRRGQVSEPTITKPSSFIRSGKSGACAVKVTRLIQGDPSHVSATQACLKAELPSVNGGGVGRKSAEAVVLFRRVPAPTGRAEP